MTARPYLNQADPEHNKPGIFVGRSKKKFSAVGCCLEAFAQALRKLGIDGAATGPSVQARCLAAWDQIENSSTMPFAKGSAAAYVGRLGNGNDAVVHDKVNRVEGHMASTLVENLKAGHPVLMLVDKDGDATVDHWLCGLFVDGDDIVYADPDGGYEGRMHRQHLEGYSPTSKHRYRLLGIRVVTKA